MAHLFLAAFLLVFGLNILLSLSLPNWIMAILAVVAGVLLIVQHFSLRVTRKKSLD